MSSLRARVIALAALVQAVYLVDCVARRGAADAEDVEACVRSLFAGPEDGPAARFGGLHRIHTGLRLALLLLEGRPFPGAKSVMTYGAGLMALERKLAGNEPMLARVGEGMARIRKQADYFGDVTHENVFAGLAGLYGETLSTLRPRIIVRGKPEYLRNSANTHRVRALLLAGIRAAHLWRSEGGGHLTLLFGRRRMAREARVLLKEASTV